MPYTIITSYTADDYKRPVNRTERILAETFEDAKALAVGEYLDRLTSMGLERVVARAPSAPLFFEILSKAFGSFSGAAEGEDEEAAEEAFEARRADGLLELGNIVDPFFDYVQENEDELFRGEYVPKSFALIIEKDDAEYAKPDLEDRLGEFFANFEDEYQKAREEEAAKAPAKKAPAKKAKAKAKR